MGGTAGWCLIVAVEYSKESGVRGSASLKTRPGIPDGLFRVIVVGRRCAAPGTGDARRVSPCGRLLPQNACRPAGSRSHPRKASLGAGGITLLPGPLRLTNTAGRPAAAGTDGAGFESREASAVRPLRR
ncbi:hypothetical protein [Paenibacillus sp. GbtcB18]|uniref:hypothetical protein n=1 Tax=Paenibacillus sp. GbtcB18 TaxID=2824763 RepID=UPI001C303F7F|nr:hypothetical protein [Paenibacillus sp. GbtcB18]